MADQRDDELEAGQGDTAAPDERVAGAEGLPEDVRAGDAGVGDTAEAGE